MNKQIPTLTVRVTTGLALAILMNAALAEPIEMKYRQPGVDRVVFSQTGWQDMSPVSEGNAISGYIRHEIVGIGRKVQEHKLEFADISVHYLVPEKMHVKQPSEMITGIALPVITTPGKATRVNLTSDEIARVPFLAGITPSTLVVDLPMMLPPLAPNPISPGDTWKVKDELVIPTRIPPGHRQNPGAEPQFRENRIKNEITYEFVGITERPKSFMSRGTVAAMEIHGQGKLFSVGERPGGRSEMDERIEIVAYFDPQAGRWLEVKHEATSRMTVSMGEREMEGNMGFTNQYRYVRSEP